MYEVGILLQCVFYIVGHITVPATCTCTYVQLYCSLWSAAGYCASCYGLCQLQLYQRMSATGTLPASTKQITGTCTQSSFDKSSFDKTVPAADQQMSATVQRMSAGVQRMSATVQRMSANFQNKAVSKYFWNMYQLMSAAVHVLRYVLYQRIPDARFA